ncbi:hypothetical protein FA95DRAFT_1344545 [Auriscalpium vulgare]|uniref:Uncharacterized protein n=1 Tax=Auriscalpium vulgare TaxID=40419 RepID=A0ACB8RRT1_9AGAM|nr:hypothetical protein FA95DRAFT_1344545 [Auriscalpium vulgare]
MQSPTQRPNLPPSALWARLLRKPTFPAAAAMPAHTQLAPSDKAQTSTRILLHDTHARLETFGERTGRLVKEVEDARREIVRVGEEAESARERAADVVVQTVNRCQTMLQKAVGEPVQTREVAILRAELASVSTKMTALDSKLDALRTLVQDQNRALQMLQDQQSRAHEQHAQTVALLAPLLPLLQALPLHIDLARAAVVEKIHEAPKSHSTSRSPKRNDPVERSSSPPTKRRRLAEGDERLHTGILRGTDILAASELKPRRGPSEAEHHAPTPVCTPSPELPMSNTPTDVHKPDIWATTAHTTSIPPGTATYLGGAFHGGQDFRASMYVPPPGWKVQPVQMTPGPGKRFIPIHDDDDEE